MDATTPTAFDYSTLDPMRAPPVSKTNDPTNWKWRLAVSAAGHKKIAFCDGEPDYGFYRVRNRDKTTWRLITFWYEDGAVRCQMDKKDETDPVRIGQIWSRACSNPIDYDLYQKIHSGESWPDLSSAVSNDIKETLGGGEDTYESICARIDNLALEAERFIAKGEATDKDTADVASDVANRLAQLQTTADTMREAEKRPFLDKCTAIQAKWKPVIDTADIYKRLKAVVCTPFLVKEKRRLEQEQEAARQAAQKAAQEAREAEQKAAQLAAEAAKSNDAAVQAQAAQAAQQAEQAFSDAQSKVSEAKAINNSPVTVGTRGRGVHLSSKKVIVITDRARVLDHFKDREEVTEVLQKLCNACLRAKVPVPGTEVTTEDQAV